MALPKEKVRTLAILLVMATVLVGCSRSGVDRVEVSGTVTYKGEPVVAGQVLFEPDPEKANTGPQGYARIKDGKYRTLNDLGSVGGHVLVRINVCDGNASPALPFGNSIFMPPYETRIELPNQSSVQDFDIPPQEELAPEQGTSPELERFEGAS